MALAALLAALLAAAPAAAWDNHRALTKLALRDAAEGLIADLAPRTASEDFAFMLQARPGSFLFVGTGDGAPLHSPRYRFNDAVIAPAAAFWARLAETYLS